MIIRQAETTELHAVGALTLAAYVADGHLSVADDYAHELRDAAARHRGAELAVAVEEDGTLLGTVTFALAGSQWAEISRPGESEFRMLAIPAHARGRGVGEALARWCVDRARAHGCTAVAISTMPTMHSAHRIYERLGFVRAAERDWRPAPQVLLIAYHLDLTTGPLEPPRYCAQCRRRMVVQVLPRGWSARCSEHGLTSSA